MQSNLIRQKSEANSVGKDIWRDKRIPTDDNYVNQSSFGYFFEQQSRTEWRNESSEDLLHLNGKLCDNSTKEMRVFLSFVRQRLFNEKKWEEILITSHKSQGELSRQTWAVLLLTIENERRVWRRKEKNMFVNDSREFA